MFIFTACVVYYNIAILYVYISVINVKGICVTFVFCPHLMMAKTGEGDLAFASKFNIKVVIL